jgi:hypothetical protein
VRWRGRAIFSIVVSAILWWRCTIVSSIVGRGTRSVVAVIVPVILELGSGAIVGIDWSWRGLVGSLLDPDHEVPVVLWRWTSRMVIGIVGPVWRWWRTVVGIVIAVLR